jgi:hypothetical protein
MHAYAFKDPVFFALNFAEQERTAGDLGQFCIGCHSPIGTLTGTTGDFFDPETMPDVVRAGISCDVCHSLTAASPSATEAGTSLALHPGNTKYGPLPSSAGGEGVHATEQREVFGNSAICRACHNLPVRGLEVEETYDEWEDSIWASRGDSDCQDCHMPEYGPARAAVSGPERPSLHRHWFTGVDVALTSFPNAAANRMRVEELLRNSASLLVEAPAEVAIGDTLAVVVSVINDKTGHALPSGTSFSRQMWIEITATADAGADTLYRSGNLDANGDLRDSNSELDPDGDPDLVNFNTVLEGGPDVTVFTASGIRNRLLQPFERRDTTYRVPIPAGTTGPVEVAVRLRFRPLPPFKVRRLGRQDLVPLIPIFDMAGAEHQVILR